MRVCEILGTNSRQFQQHHWSRLAIVRASNADEAMEKYRKYTSGALLPFSEHDVILADGEHCKKMKAVYSPQSRHFFE